MDNQNNASNSENTQQYDIFLSFDTTVQAKATKLKTFLTKKFSFKVFSSSSNTNLFKLSTIIENSKLIICFISKGFLALPKCKQEFSIACSNNKTIFGLLLDKLQNDELNTLLTVICKTKLFNIYEEPESLESLDGPLFRRFIDTVEFILYKDTKRRESKIRLGQENYENGSQIHKTVIQSFATHQKETLQNSITIPISVIKSEEVVIQDAKNPKKKYSLTSANAITIPQFRMLRSCALFHYISGLNRITFMKSTGRYLITSSYNKAVAIIDKNGIWLEKRNFGKLLAEPYGICTNDVDQIYIGDNFFHYILVLDYNLKYVKKIGETILKRINDLFCDTANQELYSLDLYDSLVFIFDLTNGKLKRKIYVDTPSNIKVLNDSIFILSTDYIYILNRTTYEPLQTISFVNCDNISGLYVDEDYHIYTTVTESTRSGDISDTNKSRSVYLYVIRSNDKMILKRVKLPQTQVNDLFVGNDKMSFICDTHLDLFEFYGFSGEQ